MKTLRGPAWEALASACGSSAAGIMTSLLLDCGIFMPVDKTQDNLFQLSGIPVTDLLPCTSEGVKGVQKDATESAISKLSICREPQEISFIRNRMLYARPGTNALGQIRFGLRHIHVLNRFCDVEANKQTVHIMKYVFPRQFGLHNVFTSEVSRLETSQKFKDYTLREHEIFETKSGHAKYRDKSLPARLRGAPFGLVSTLRKNHKRCPYVQLLRHHCPIRTQLDYDTTQESVSVPATSSPLFTQPALPDFSTKVSSTSSIYTNPKEPRAVFTDLATPPEDVAAFCRAVISRLLPFDTFGNGRAGERNCRHLLSKINHFISCRKYETLSLHHVIQDIKIKSMTWLSPWCVDTHSRLAKSDFTKRQEILLEFVYYLFDSILIPLIKSHFHVTESSTGRYRLFYFRHDVWRVLTEPSLQLLRLRTLKEMHSIEAQKILHARTLGSSQLRLLPKLSSTRPIMNLRRKVTRLVDGKKVLSRSINNVLDPVFHLLRLASAEKPACLGSALFSIGDAHNRLKQFRASFQGSRPTFYFVKVDVKSCFDTIPHGELMRLVRALIDRETCKIGRHAEIRGSAAMGPAGRPFLKYIGQAYPSHSSIGLDQPRAQQLGRHKHQILFSDTGSRQSWSTKRLLGLLRDHVEDNVIKIGKKYFRQRNGIPQGSVLSSLLCSLFYGDFERTQLGFLTSNDSLLLRLIDDFLLISINKHQATKFLETMLEGSSKYGITVNAKKSLANFALRCDGGMVPRHHGGLNFPYCGVEINTMTLEIGKDRKAKDPVVSNGLTANLGQRPGRAFHRKVLDSCRKQLSVMLLDTGLSSRKAVLRTLQEICLETAMKMHAYLQSVNSNFQPSEQHLIRIIQELGKLLKGTIQRRRVDKSGHDIECSIGRTHIEWLISTSFLKILSRKPSKYQSVLRWLQKLVDVAQGNIGIDRRLLSHVEDAGWEAMEGYRF